MLKAIRILVISIVFSFATLGVQTVFAQGTDLGTISGTVMDTSKAVIPRAQVVVKNVATNLTYKAVTNNRGFFQIPAIPAGSYVATITAKGFATAQVNNIVLQITGTVNINPVLQVSATSTTVQITSASPMLDTQNQTIGMTLTPKAITQLPTNTRDIYQLLYINPNIQASDEPGDFKFMGAQSYGASFSVDGQRANGGIFGQQTASQPTLDAVGSMTVLSSGYDAEFTGVAAIRVTTKSGTSQYHGSAVYNNVNSAFSAWTDADKLNKQTFSPTPFQPKFTRTQSNDNVMALTFGGPIPKLKRTFFFGAYEEEWEESPDEFGGNVPGPLLQQGNFSQLANGAKPDVPANITLSAAEIAQDTVDGNGKQFIKIPPRLLNPITQKIIALAFPKIGAGAAVSPITGAVSGYAASAPAETSTRSGDLRIDHTFNDSNRMWGVYHGSAQSAEGSPVSAPYIGLGLLTTTRLNSMLSLSYTHVFSPSMVNEVRGGYNIQNLFTHANTKVGSFLSSIGFSQADIAAYGSVAGQNVLSLFGNPTISFGSGLSGLRNGGRSSDRNMNQDLITFGDTFTWIVGRHTLKMGGDFVRNAAIDGFASTRSNPQGSFAYTGSGPNGFANFLLGEPPHSAGVVNKVRPPMNVHNWEDGIFAEDSFKITPKLTLNFGMRYDLNTPFIDANDIMANFDPNYHGPDGQHGRYVIPSDKTLQYVSPGFLAVGYVTASESGEGVGRGLVKLDKEDFGPRVGFAYSLNNRNVIRGGYGIYYPTSAAQIYRDAIATNPFNQGLSLLSTSASPLAPWPTGGETTGVSPNQGGVVNGLSRLPSANYIPTDLKDPRIQHWNLTYEFEATRNSVVRLSYLGAHAGGLIMGIDLSMLAPNNNPFGTTIGDGITPCDPSGTQAEGASCQYSPADMARQPFPLLGDYILGFGNVGHANTSIFQTQFQHRAGNFLFMIAYTYQNQASSGIDVGDSSLAGEAYNGLEPNSDYGPASWVSNNRVVSYGVYDLPIGRGQRFGGTMSRLANIFAGGWETTYNMFAKSGVPFTPYWDCLDCDPVNPGNVATGSIDATGTFNSTSVRPILIGNPRKNVPKGYQWNYAAFGIPDITGADLFTQTGAMKRNSLIGPGTWGANFGIHKSFQLTDRVSLQVGADMNNVFNHKMASPDANYAYSGSENGPSYAAVGYFNILVDQTPSVPGGPQPKILPIQSPNNPSGNTVENIGQPFGNFGQNYQTFGQEGVSGNREIRLRARITF